MIEGKVLNKDDMEFRALLKKAREDKLIRASKGNVAYIDRLLNADCDDNEYMIIKIIILGLKKNPDELLILSTLLLSLSRIRNGINTNKDLNNIWKSFI